MSNQRPPSGGEPLRPKKKKKRSRRWLGYTLLVLFGMAIGVAGMAGTFVWKAYQSLPAFEDLDPNLTSFVYDNKGEVITKLAAEENRTLIKDITEIPEEVLNAFIDTEDKRFKQHHGVDFYRLAGSVYKSAKYYLGFKNSQLEGGSTITMQLAGNAFLDRQDISLTRKVQEMLLAFQMEKTFTKDEILLRYLNQVSFGGMTAGLEEAAHTYFSKSAKELTVSEAAMLAGMLKGPSLYNPKTNMEGAMERRAIVLDLMVQNSHLDAAKAEALKAQQVTLNLSTVVPDVVQFNGDWYVDYVVEVLTSPSLAAKYGTPLFEERDLLTKGLKIYTALDTGYQKLAQEQMNKILLEKTKYYGKTEADVPEGAVVIMDHRNGHVKALVGGREHTNLRGLNLATGAYRQPGSAIKPLAAYLPAIDLLGWGPATVVDDSPPMLAYPKQDDVWPENYDFKYNGLVSMRHALEQSLNAVAVRTLQQVTPRKGLEFAQNLGLSTLVTPAMNPGANDENLSLALGGITKGVTLLDMSTAYGTLGSMGTRTEPVVITKIENKNGLTIFEAAPQKKPVVRKESVWLMVDIMKGSIRRGTAAYESKGWHGWPAAGKTGTTENWHDAWFVGFTSEIVTGVWTGYRNDDGQQRRLPSRGWESWTGAGPPTTIWTAIMDGIYKEAPPDWPRPAGVVEVDVCNTSGLLPSPLCGPGNVVRDYFRKGTEPSKTDNVLTTVKVVRQPFINPTTKQPIVDKQSGKVVERYYLWEEGCQGLAEELTLLKRPNDYVKHPRDPWNFARYWPADWWKEVPTDKCIPSEAQPPVPGDPSVTPPPGNGTTPPPGTNPPGDGTTPPTTPPGNGTNPPGDGQKPPIIVLPPVLPGR